MEAPAEGLELASLKEQFRGRCSDAFHEAIRSLQPRERNLLRQHYLDELTLDEMAVLYRVHRATVARWLSAARSTLLGRTRDILQRELGLNANEVDSIVALVRSRLDLSAGIFMSTVTPSDE